MAVFPETPKPIYPVIFEAVWQTKISPETENGGEQRRKGWTYAKYDAVLNYKYLSISDFNILFDFYMARCGAYEAFYFFDIEIAAHKSIFLVQADGAIDTFDIPGKSTSSRTLYENGIVKSSGFSYLTGGGAGDSDRISFSSAPPDGTIYEIDFTGYLRIHCRFKQGKLSRERFKTVLFRTGIELIGLK